MARHRRPKSERGYENRSDSGAAVSPQQIETEQGSGTSWITDSAIIIALITFIAYLSTLFYEVGFYQYFSIPYNFISLSQTLVLVTYGHFALYVGLLFLLAIGAWKLSEYVKHIRTKTTIVMVALFALCLIVLGYTIFTWPDYLDRVRTSAMSAMPFAPLTALIVTCSALFAMGQPNRTRLVVFTITLYIVAFFFREIGKWEAGRWEEFPVVKQSLGVPGVSEFVVLRGYGEYLLAVPLNRVSTGNKFEKKLILLKTSEMNKTPLTLEKVGPLQPVEVKTGEAKQ